MHNVARHYGVRTQTHKLIHYYKIGEWELFDLEADPDELNSIYGQPGTEEVTRELRAELRLLRAQYGIPNNDDSFDAYDRIRAARDN